MITEMKKKKKKNFLQPTNKSVMSLALWKNKGLSYVLLALYRDESNM